METWSKLGLKARIARTEKLVFQNAVSVKHIPLSNIWWYLVEIDDYSREVTTNEDQDYNNEDGCYALIPLLSRCCYWTKWY